MAEYLARVTWDSVIRYRKEVNKNNSRTSSYKLPLTNQYGSNQPILKKFKYGDGLWLFTAPIFGKGKQKRILPPSILGRIKITHQKNKGENTIKPAAGAPKHAQLLSDIKILEVSKYDYWYCGIPGDVLPIHNAFLILKSLTFKGRAKRVDPECEGCKTSKVPKLGPYGHIMQHFQSIRLLTTESANILFKLQDFINSRRSLFLSHKHSEAASLVEDIAKQLNNDTLCWWDKQELPQVLYDDLLLKNILNDGIRQAGWFIVFLTPKYVSTGWSKKEWDNTLKLTNEPGLKRKPKILPVLLGGNLPKGVNTEQAINVGKNAKAIAEAVMKRIF